MVHVFVSENVYVDTFSLKGGNIKQLWVMKH